MAKKKPDDDFDVDAAMAAEGIAMPDDEVDAAMAAEGIAGPPKMTAPQPKSRQVAEEQLFSGLGESQPVVPPKPWVKSSGQSANPMGKTRHSHLLDEIDPEADRDAGKSMYQGFTNVMSLGIGNRIRDTYPEGETFSTKDRARLEAERPGEAAAGKGLGYLASGIGGAGRVLDQGARGIVGLLGMGGTAGGRIASAGAAGAMSGAVQGGAIEDDAKGGAISGFGFGAGARAVGEAGKGIARLLGADKWIGKFRDAKADGRMARVEADSPSPDTEGQFAAGAKARDRIVARDAELAAKEDGAYAAAVEPHKQTTVDKAVVNQPLIDMSTKNTLSSGAKIDPELDAQMVALSKKLGPEPTVEDVLALRRSLQDDAGFGAASPTDAQMKTRKVYGALRQGVREASPEVAAADDAYGNAQKARARRGDIMTGREDGGRPVDLPEDAGPQKPLKQAMRVADEKAAATRLGRLGDDSKEGGAQAGYLRELGEQDPEFKAALSDLEAYKAWAATRFGFSNFMPTNLSKAVDVPLRFAQQNARALGARVALPAAEAAGEAGSGVAASAGTAGTFFDMMGDAARRRKKK